MLRQRVGKSLTGGFIVPEPPVDNGTRLTQTSTLDGSYVRNSVGVYTLVSRLPSPRFIFSMSGSQLNSPSHFFISLSLSIPNCVPIHTYALVDSGASMSCISEKFSNRHSLPRCLKDVPVPIMAVDERPIASGLITQDIVATLSVDKHSEILPLAVVSVGYPIILGLDWLCRHNPKIDWEDMNLSLDCCGLSRSFPVTVSAKGYGLKPKLSQPTLISISAVGLGFGLSDATSFVASRLSCGSTQEKTPTGVSPEASASLDACTPSPESFDSSDSPNSTNSPRPSFLSSSVRWTGYGHSMPGLIPPSVPDIKIINRRQFSKYAKADPEAVCCLRFHNSTSSTFINSFSFTTKSDWDDIDDIDPHDPLPEFTPPESTNNFEQFVPEKYRPWASTVFNPAEFERLPDHHPYNIDIELEDGKSPPFGPLYRLTPTE